MKPFMMAVMLSLSASLQAFAGEADVKAAQQTVTSQLEAFRSGRDGDAYSHAAPNIVRMFPTLESFIAMVESGYRPVRSPDSFALARSSEVAPGKVAQEVLLVGPDGKNYTAVYFLEKQADGSWKVAGVSLRQSADLST